MTKSLMRYVLYLTFFAILICSCSSSNSNKDKFYSVNKPTDLLISPSKSSKKLIDTGASTLNDTLYRTLIISNKLIILDTNGKFSKVQVIEPQSLSNIYIGWILTDNLVQFNLENEKETELEVNTPTNSNTSTQSITPTPTGSEALKARISNGIKDINKGDDISKIDLSTLQNVNIAVTVFKIYAGLIKDGSASSDKEILRLTNTLRNKAVASQIKYFPRIRRAYFQLTKDKLWEHDIDVMLGGNSNSILKFTGGYFAANANIKETQEALQEMLTTLRFKQTQYRWYKGQDEYTFYSIISNKDSALID